MKRITEKGKQREGRGQGRGADYKPYIQGRESIPREPAQRP